MKDVAAGIEIGSSLQSLLAIKTATADFTAYRVISVN
jgi:hypothetical protein